MSDTRSLAPASSSSKHFGSTIWPKHDFKETIMKRTTNRILTTHAGSLPRPQKLLSLVFAQESGESVDPAELDREVRSAVRGIVKKQAELGVDVLNDGE